MRRLGSPFVWTMAAAAATAVAFWAIVLAPGATQILANLDVLAYFYPIYETTYARVARGEVPLWNPYQLCGAPWIATLQGGFFYPPHVLYVILPTPTALAVLAAGHLALAAAATVAFARRVGIGLLGAFLAGTLLVLRGRTPDLIVSPNFLEAIAWLPVGALGVVAIASGRLAGGVAMLGGALGLSFLAGYPQPTVYCLYAWATLLAALVARRPRAWVGAGAAFVAAVAAGALLAAAQLLPTQELSALGLRQTRGLEVGQMYPLGAPTLVSRQLWSTFVGSGLGGDLASFGVAGAALVVLAPLARARTVAWWALVLGTCTLLFGLGETTPFFRAALRLPALDWFRVPNRAFVVADFCFAIVAGTGLDAVVRAPTTGALRRRLAVLLVAAGAAGVVAARQHHEVAVYVATTVVVGAAATMAFPAKLRTAFAVAVVAAAVLQAATVPPPGRLMPYDHARTALYAKDNSIYEHLRAAAGHDRFWLLSGGPPAHALMPKQATRHGIRSLDDYEPLTTRRHADYLTYLMLGRLDPPHDTDIFLGSWWMPHATNDPLPVRRHLLDLAAVRLIGVPTTLQAWKDLRAFVEELTPHGGNADIIVYENPTALPRAYVVHHTEPAPPVAELMPRLADPAYDPFVSVYVEGPAPIVAGPDAPPYGHAATFVRDDETVVELEATAEAAGLLVLADAYYPGWTATLDGAPATIVPVNHLFRGVAVPAGTHRVRFEYRPWRIGAGMIASGLAACVLVGLVVAGRRAQPALKARTSSSTPPPPVSS